MNALIVGSRKETVLTYLPDKFLLIDDGDLIDQLDIPRAKHFDVREHAFNPLKDMTYRRACEFVDVLDAVFPEGDSTLTKAKGNFQILEALLSNHRSLDRLIPNTKETEYAYQKIQRLLLSPVLKNVLLGPTNMSFKGTILARLNRAELGDFDAFVIGNLLIAQYQGPVVIPDFGFYAHQAHRGLIRQNRLIAGVSTLGELPDLAQQLLLIERKVGSHSTADDAETLALYAGIPRGTNGYSDFIAGCIA